MWVPSLKLKFRAWCPVIGTEAVAPIREFPWIVLGFATPFKLVLPPYQKSESRETQSRGFFLVPFPPNNVVRDPKRADVATDAGDSTFEVGNLDRLSGAERNREGGA